MPLPLIPFAIKGAFVLGKVLLAKGSAAKVAVATAKTVKTIGVANSLAGAAAACVVVGGVKWTTETIAKAKLAYDLARNDDLVGATKHLIGIATSVHDVTSNTLGSDLSDWAARGYPADRSVLGLAKKAYSTAQRAKPV